MSAHKIATFRVFLNIQGSVGARAGAAGYPIQPKHHDSDRPPDLRKSLAHVGGRALAGASYRCGDFCSRLSERAQPGVRVRVDVCELNREPHSAYRVDDHALQGDLAGRQHDDDGGKLSALRHRAAALDVTPAVAQIADAGMLLAPLAVPPALEVPIEAVLSPTFAHARCPRARTAPCCLADRSRELPTRDPFPATRFSADDQS